MKTEFKFLAIEHLSAGRFQPRADFAEAALLELSHSIAQQGIIEPLIVRALSTNRYEILAGERRWRAAMLAGLSEVPCLISDYKDEQAAAITLIENIQRQDLNVIEEAQGYQRLVHEFHFQQEDIACIVGKSRSHVANILRILTLCEAVQTQIRQGQLSLGHAKMLVGLNENEQKDLAKKIKKNQWSVRQLEQVIRELKNTAPKGNPKKDRDVERLQQKIAEQIGAPVQIISEEGEGGWLKVKFFDNDTLAGLLDKLGLGYD